MPGLRENWAETADVLRAAGVETEVLSLPTERAGTLPGAREVHTRMRQAGAGVCIALGGGSVIDTAKLADAARREPWLLDQTIWRRPTGVLRLLSAGETYRPPHLVAVPTRPGSAAEVSARAAIAPQPWLTRRLLSGERLRPSIALVEPEMARTLSRAQWWASVCEILFRVLGPFLCTERSTPAVDRTAGTLIAELLAPHASQNRPWAPTAQQRRRVAELSIATATGEHVGLWQPAMPSWWCVQNTLTTHSGLSKGELTAWALPTLLARIEQGDVTFGSPARLKLLKDVAGARVLDSIRATCLQARGSGSRAGLRWTEDELCAWSEEVSRLWGHHPGVASLGADGVRALLRDVGS